MATEFGPQTDIIRTLIARADLSDAAEIGDLAAEWDGDHGTNNKPRDLSFAITKRVSLAPQWRPLAFAEARPVVSPWYGIVGEAVAHSAMHAIFDAIAALLIEHATGGTDVGQADLNRLMRPVTRTYGNRNQW